ncbi:MAG: hypothetical protein MI684_01740 [Chlorobiales bacterium]|nr:hypothetical protein [Chlorobiales bacterium]
MEKERLLSFIRDVLETCREETGFTGRQHVFLVDIYVKGGSPSSKIEVLVDTDSGISIAECLSVNRCLSSAVDANDEVKGLVGDDYELTVSSPGIGAPIKHLRQYIRHTGHLLRVQYTDGDREVQEVSGRLLQAEVLDVPDPFIVLEPVTAGKGRKGGRSEPVRLELGSINRAVVEVEF